MNKSNSHLKELVSVALCTVFWLSCITIHNSPLAASASPSKGIRASNAKPNDQKTSDQSSVDGVTSAAPAALKTDSARTSSTDAVYGQLPMSFEANQGQTDAEVKFMSRGPGYQLFLTSSEAVFALTRGQTQIPHQSSTNPQREIRKSKSAVLRMKLAGAQTDLHIEGQDQLPGKSNYFIGNNPDQWHANVPNYSKVHYRDVYPGIDLMYYGNQQQLEYDLVVAPGANPQGIALNFEGARSLKIDRQGDLVIKTEGGSVLLRKPDVYQDRYGARQIIAAAYELKSRNEVGFRLGTYDRSQPLVIDPVLVYSSYLGGSSRDVGNAITVDSDGNAYVTGGTNSTNFPVSNALQSGLLGNGDAFVTKLNAAGSAVIYSTYLGGHNNPSDEQGRAIALDSAGNAYIGGTTTSPDFPITSGVVRPSSGAGNDRNDAFVTKLTATGALSYSTYLTGGFSFTQIRGIAVDSSANAYVVGGTDLFSRFPVTAGAAQPNAGGGAATSASGDAFLVKLNSTATQYLYGTFIGGGGSELATGIAVDNSGHAYVSGYTTSSDLPTKNPLQATFGGNSDAFVAKYDTTANGSASLIYSTYLGGNGDDAREGGFAGVEAEAYVAVDSAGNAYVSGPTRSSNFPTTAGALQKTLSGTADIFISKLNPGGSALVYSTLLGGSAYDISTSLALDSSGNAYLTGISSSGDFPLSSQLGPYRTNNAFVSKLNASGSALIFSTFLGGNAGRTVGYGIALDGAGAVYVTGDADNQNDFPTTTNAFQKTLGGDHDAFITKIGSVPTQPFSILTVSPKKGGDTGTVTVSIVGSGFSSGATVKLTRPGQTDIVGDQVRISAGGTVLDTKFDLRGKARGTWDVVVTNPDTTLSTFSNGFTIEAGQDPHVFVNVLGRDSVRVGRASSVFINYGNSGNVDAYDLILYLRIPADVAFSIEGLQQPKSPVNTPPGVVNQVGTVVGEALQIPIYLYKIPAGHTGTITLKITAPVGSAGADLPVSAALLVPPPSNFSKTGDFAFPSYSLTIIATALADGINRAASGDNKAISHSIESIRPSFLGCDLWNPHPGNRPGNLPPTGATPDDVLSVLSGSIQTLFDPYNFAAGISITIAGAALSAIFPGVALAIIAGGLTIDTILQFAAFFNEIINNQCGHRLGAQDPNDKVGAGGVGSPRFLSGGEPLPYAVFFENVGTATAAAQEVVVTDQLDPALVDLTTFSLGPIAFGTNRITPPPGLKSYTTDVDLRPGKNLMARITAVLDANTGLVTWRFQSIDPATGQPTTDPVLGFLPPDKTPPEGEGNVQFTVMPKSGISTGTQVPNKARVVFDVNAPIDTPQWLNTIDNTQPTSHVSQLLASQSSVIFNVSWSGADTGSGLKDYTIYVSENGGPYAVWLASTTSTAANYVGKPSSSYSFYTIARDQAGNLENAKTTAETSTATRTDITNAVDDSRFLVRQHYLDFLSREPDSSGWDFWTNQIGSCGNDLQCREVRRINVSASFFLSIEFQQTGYLVERMYKVGFGDATGTSTLGSSHQLPVPIIRFNEFLNDTLSIGQGVVVLAPGWEQLLESNKQSYASGFVQTSRFIAAFPTTMTPSQFVDKLDLNAGRVLSASERTTAINLFSGAADTSNTAARAQALRQVAEDTDLYNAEFNRAFVLSEYFGYLRRNPNDAPDADHTGYDFWLTKLNQFNGNYITAEMVKAFLSASEYRSRFGQP